MKLTYILKSVCSSIYRDFIASVMSLARLRELVNLFFWSGLVLMMFGKVWQAIIAFIISIVIYIWKVIRQGEWKHKMREQEYNKNEP